MRHVVVLGLVSLVALAGCGGGAGERASPPTQPSSPSKTPSWIDRLSEALNAFRAGGGGLIAFAHKDANDKWDIYVMQADGSGQQRLTRTGSETEPAWSPDGERLAFVSGRDGNAEIYVMNADGSGQRRMTQTTVAEGWPSWSPDGSEIIFTRSAGEDASDVYLMRADGSDVRRITHDGTSMDASFSPDGKKIALWNGHDFTSGVYVMNADGSGLTLLTSKFKYAWGADWSPDGSQILFVGVDEGESEHQAIQVVNADGSGIKEIAPVTGYWIDEPEWSPDGTRIAYFSDTFGPGDIWTMKADGSRQRVLTSGGDNHHPSWQPVP